jgi:hypothetical protein
VREIVGIIKQNSTVSDIGECWTETHFYVVVCFLPFQCSYPTDTEGYNYFKTFLISSSSFSILSQNSRILLQKN